MRNVEPPCDLTCREAIGLLFHEQSECLKPGRLREGGEGFDGEVLFHLSGIIDTICDSQLTICYPSRFGPGDIVEQSVLANAQAGLAANIIIPLISVVAVLIGALIALWRRPGEGLPA